MVATKGGIVSRRMNELPMYITFLVYFQPYINGDTVISKHIT